MYSHCVYQANKLIYRRTPNSQQMFCVVVDIEDLKVGYITLSGDVESDLFVGAQTVIMLAVTMPDVGLVDKSFSLH